MVAADTKSVVRKATHHYDVTGYYSFRSAIFHLSITSSYNGRDDGSGEGVSRSTTIVAGKTYTQYLTLPPGTWPAIYTEDMPNAFLWRPAGRVILVTVLDSHPSADMGYRVVVMYSCTGYAWLPIEYDPDLTLFSDRGGFYTDGTNLYVWDRVIDWNVDMSADSIFKLRRYKIVGERLVGPEIRFTRKKYFGGVDPKPDPLAEFGLKWRHWGKRAEVVDTLEL